eukprot:3897023-Pyramimonas_sp.AAC.1
MECVYNGKKEKEVDMVGFRPHRCAIFTDYTAESVKDVLMTLDEVMAWRTNFEEMDYEKLLKQPKLVIDVPAALGVE